jgi:hypothetical protein
MYRKTTPQTPHKRRIAAALIAAGLAVALVGCSASASNVRADLRKQLSDVDGLDSEQRDCVNGLIDDLSDDDAKEIADATSGSDPDMENPKVASFIEETQGCIVTASSVKDLVMSQLPSDLTAAQSTCMETFLDGLDETTLDAIAGGDAAALTNGLVDCAVGG